MTSLSVVTGDCALVLPTLAADSFDAIVTDPPYFLGFMNKGWDKEDTRALACDGLPGSRGHGRKPGEDAQIKRKNSVAGQAFHEAWARAALRVAKPGAYMVAFGGTRTFHRLTVAIEDAGWEIRDCLMWLYGCGFPKSLNLEGGRGTALKPAWEPIVLARKTLAGTVAANVQTFGTGALRIGECRIGCDERTYSPKGTSSNAAMIRVPEHRNGLSGESVTVTGRWPANLIHDGSPEVVAMFPDSDGQAAPTGPVYGCRGTVSAFGDYGPRPEHEPRNDSGSAARFFFSGKATRADREEGLADFEAKQRDESRAADALGANNPRNRGGLARRNVHPTVKPTAIMRWLCRLVTPAGGTVLDPFCGSGSTGKACAFERLGFVGIEKSEEYATIARARIAWAHERREPEQLSLLEQAV